METKDNRSQALRRASELLDATKQFLEKQDFYALKEKMVWIEKPDKGENCLYWKPYQETYGRCTLPANRGEFCSKEYVSVRCPLPGWDYDDVKEVTK